MLTLVSTLEPITHWPSEIFKTIQIQSLRELKKAKLVKSDVDSND